MEQQNGTRQKKVLFLYTEMAGYLYAGLQQLIELYGAEVHVVHYAVNREEAPFVFDKPDDIRHYERAAYNEQALKDLVSQITPDIILVAGWRDKAYLAVCRQYMSRIPTVLLFDNRWRGTFRQRIAGWLGSGYIRKRFRFAWVPGIPQKTYALRLGFVEDNIATGFYTADVKLYQQAFQQYHTAKEKHLPRRFLYVGRYADSKGIGDLWKAFDMLQRETPNAWELWCFGTGKLKGKAIQHEKIRHFGFVQPGELVAYLKDCGVFVLPSRSEPWGVVVHEMAAAGFPLVCSDEVGAATEFLEEGENGFLHKKGNVVSLKNALSRISHMQQSDLFAMGERSAAKAMTITPVSWARTLMAFLK